ncbi:MAG TPA: polysaccharide biosynthesis/export family protein [Thermoanaerobaculia bacterium]|jgi:polysaccharide export outer membrane protein|nr:polysaccharide biosynthesis/export family protein [Thermoanaerobaculia bacterium]
MRKIAAHSLVLLLVVWATAANAQVPPGAQGKDPAYRVGPRDLLDIRVYEAEKLNGERRVSEAGLINLPLLGDVAVAGKNTAEIGLVLKKLLEEKYVQRASVDVQVLEFRSRPISVIGAVKQPGNLGFSGRWTLIEALTAAGGLTENHGNVIHVLRRADNGLSDQVTIDLDDLMLRADPRVNIPIFANDLINVPGTVEVTVYCLGEVSRPGALAFKSNERISLLTAIAHAGGLTDRASKRILIKKAGGSNGPPEITVDYNKILAGKEPDVELRHGDVVVVKESFF